MILFPKRATATERLILLLYVTYGENKKAAAHHSNVSIRHAQRTIKKYAAFLSGYKGNATVVSLDV